MNVLIIYKKAKQTIFRSIWYKQLATTLVLGSFITTGLQLKLTAQEAPTIITNQASYTYTDPNSSYKYQGISSQLQLVPAPLISKLGKILGCAGTILPDYTGVSVGLYETNINDPTGTELGKLVALTRTELPDTPNNKVPQGTAPNIENSNPYFLSNNPAGVYNFLLDANRGQTTSGKTYILVVYSPPNSIYQQRRVKIQIVGNDQTNNSVKYIASSLDGQPLNSTGATTVEDTLFAISNGERPQLNLLSLAFTTNLCQARQLQIIKTGDRATAEPGDTAIYRISVRNLTDIGLKNTVVTDNLPLGFQFIPKSVRGELEGQAINITTDRNGNTITFRTDATIPPEKILNIAYAAQLTPDALRGNGRNSAIANALRIDNRLSTKDGPATHQLLIRPGIVADCGTIIGRVFEDKNFDGEQQTGEPGIANAVIFLEDGNRITTDPNGLFSVANVLPGSHSGVLDLSSIPGYTLAPNRKFRERNSQSRWVRLEPGGLVRMNFAVTPSRSK
ncbi:DUF11 domain-containing protein [Nostoc sp. FACHB-152]|uniref:DUF11 domain-containing protein n=1 Tax=unclassified Nostoc TaxID=2593658 RepID=UPI001687A853|nr:MULTISPECIES: DUF11 domain-containing protein [unclassified Nostoc]MBD2450401.1 DUF11 domain-containing protein [Nostoc sp. FACHB-152]MBD2471622.1 DUF11 domain-containing protein [Nostoc sp. FACHB-145]